MNLGRISRGPQNPHRAGPRGPGPPAGIHPIARYYVPEGRTKRERYRALGSGQSDRRETTPCSFGKAKAAPRGGWKCSAAFTGRGALSLERRHALPTLLLRYAAHGFHATTIAAKRTKSGRSYNASAPKVIAGTPRTPRSSSYRSVGLTYRTSSTSSTHAPSSYSFSIRSRSSSAASAPGPQARAPCVFARPSASPLGVVGTGAT